ncbi:MAG: DUF4397 domain-containing protein [Fimbriimonadaceae bacterium]|nr:DUF4397 domain-containing protein [Fimbriimonadaceae bacterium]
MRFLGKAAVVAGLLIGLIGCGTDHGGGPTNMRLRIVNLVDDSNLAQLYWMGAPVSPRSLEYREESGYQSRESGRSQADLYEVDLGTLDSETEWLTTDKEYTFFGVGSIGQGDATLVKVDDDTRPAVDKAKVRVFHGSPAAPNVDIYITDPLVDLVDVQPNYKNVAFKEITPYVPIAPGVFRIRMTLAGTKTVAIDTGTLEDLAGQVFTVCAIGDPSVGQPIRHLTLIDRR